MEKSKKELYKIRFSMILFVEVSIIFMIFIIKII